MRRGLIALWLGGCSDAEVAPEAPLPAALSPVERAVRVSVSLRGVRPDEAELAAAADPDALPGLVEAWLREPAFAETVKDLHAELWLLRDDLEPPLPSLGLLEGEAGQRVLESTQEGPLRQVAARIQRGEPYTALFTYAGTQANDVVARIYGLPYDPAGPEWQELPWTDGRPAAGVLAESELWRRHMSNGNNFHRLRADFLAETFLCAGVADREVALGSGIDLSDPHEVATAVQTVPTCVACHQVMDGLAAHLWGFKRQLRFNAVIEAYRLDCRWPYDAPVDPAFGSYLPDQFCYPVRFYDPATEEDWQDYGLPPATYYGQPGGDLRALALAIAEDPRLPDCTTRRFAGWLAQRESDELPPAWIDRWRSTFQDQGLDARALMRAIVLSDWFADPGPDGAGLLLVRAEATVRSIEALTGFRYRAFVGLPYGEVDLGTQAAFGLEVHLGGVDGRSVLQPARTLTPNRALALRRYAQAAAQAVVANDLSLPPAERRLLVALGDDLDSPEARDQQLTVLFRRVLSEPEPDLGPARALYLGLREAGVAPERAWTLVVASFLQDPRFQVI